VTGEAARAFSERETFSASELEAYLRCPYLWFYERRLTGDALDREVDALERGKLAHEVMRRFYEAWSAEGHQRVTPQALTAALELATRISAQVLSEAMPPANLYEEEMHHRARAGVRSIIQRDALSFPGFVPRYHEWSFGGEEAVDLGTFRLRGRVDRIDLGEAGLIVSDYKGSAVSPRKRFAPDGVLQVPLYALVAARSLSVPIAGGLYRSMGGSGDRGFFLKGAVSGPGLVSTDASDQAEIAQLIAEAEARAAVAVAAA
jgi:ATP-dependent helicase/DNAse subunit B